MKNRNFQLFVDTGGTFTDCIGIDQHGKQYRRKVLSNSSLRGTIEKAVSATTFKIKESWNLGKDIISGFSFRLLKDGYSDYQIVKYDIHSGLLHLNREFQHPESIERCNFEITSHEEAPVLGARLITQTPLNESFPDLSLKLGSTKGTNALLERKGAKTLLLITKGFKDLLEIGNQARPDIFAMHVEKRKKIASHIIEVKERQDRIGGYHLHECLPQPCPRSGCQRDCSATGFSIHFGFNRPYSPYKNINTHGDNGSECLPVADYPQLRQQHFRQHR